MNTSNYSLSKLRYDLMDMGEFRKPSEEVAAHVLDEWHGGERSERETVKELIHLGVIENGS